MNDEIYKTWDQLVLKKKDEEECNKSLIDRLTGENYINHINYENKKSKNN